MRRVLKRCICMLVLLSMVCGLGESVTSGVPTMVTVVKADETPITLSNPIMENGIVTYDTIYFGNYWQKDTNEDGRANKSDDKTPIKWRVLSVTGNDAFIVSDEILDVQRYNWDIYENWQQSTIREWLNTTFMNNAFDDSEQSVIKEGDGYITDRLFLLSVEDVSNQSYGFSNYDGINHNGEIRTDYVYDWSKIRKETDFASGKGLPNGKKATATGYGCGGQWWLRQRGLTEEITDAPLIMTDGEVFWEGGHVYNSCGVCPALHLDLSANTFYSYAGKLKCDSSMVNYGAADKATPTYDCIYFGNYWQKDTNGDGKADKSDDKTPIKWRVLSVDGDDAFIVSDEMLEVQRYQIGGYVDWENSKMRTWLNEDFMNDAFTVTEKEAIKLTHVENKDNQYFGTEGGNDTTDKMFLLSLEDIANPSYGFSSFNLTDFRNEGINIYGHDIYDFAKIRRPTEFASGKGFERGVADTASRESESVLLYIWRLRSPGESSKKVADVRYCGVNYSGDYADFAFGVCPAMHISLSSASYTRAGTVNWNVRGLYYDESSTDTILAGPRMEKYVSDNPSDTPSGDITAVESVSATAAKTEIKVGEITQITVNVEPSNATNKEVTYESSDTSVATVDDSGEVKAVKIGTTDITVTSKADATKKDTITFIVKSSGGGTVVKKCSHTYKESFNWSSDYTRCNLVVTCTKCGEGVTEKASVTRKITKDATCTKTGTATYFASATYQGLLYTDEKTISFGPLGHYFDNGTVTKKANTSGTSGTVTKICVTCKYKQDETIYPIKSIKLGFTSINYDGATHMPSVTVYDTSGAKVLSRYYQVSVKDSKGNTVTSPKSAGVYKVTVTFNTKYTGSLTSSFEIKNTKCTHSYKESFNWSGNNKACTLILTCTKCGVAETKDCKVKETTEKATCTKDGKKTYTATATLNGKEYSKTKKEVISALGHDYKETIKKAEIATWISSGNGSINKKCTRCGHNASEQVIYGIKTISLDEASISYDGVSHTPKVTVKDNKGKKVSADNYTVKIANSKNKEVDSAKAIGKYTVNVTFKGKLYKGSKDLTFEIKDAKFKITYVLNQDGVKNPNPSEYKASVGVAELKNLSKEGLEFLGWLDESGKKITTIPKNSTGNRTLSASWNVITYKLKLDMNGGVLNKDGVAYDDKYTVEFDVNTEYKISEQPERLGYEFVGWVDSKDKTVTKVSKGTTKNVNLKAKWREKSYKIEFKIDGKVVSSTNKKYTQTFTTEVPQKKKDKTFVEWKYKGFVWQPDTTINVKDVVGQDDTTIEIVGRYMSSDEALKKKVKEVTGAIQVQDHCTTCAIVALIRRQQVLDGGEATFSYADARMWQNNSLTYANMAEGMKRINKKIEENPNATGVTRAECPNIYVGTNGPISSITYDESKYTQKDSKEILTQYQFSSTCGTAWSVDDLVAKLDEHPSGIFLYVTKNGNMHAIAITDYEKISENSYQFYAIDSAREGCKRQKIEETSIWNYARDNGDEAFNMEKLLDVAGSNTWISYGWVDTVKNY